MPTSLAEARQSEAAGHHQNLMGEIDPLRPLDKIFKSNDEIFGKFPL